MQFSEQLCFLLFVFRFMFVLFVVSSVDRESEIGDRKFESWTFRKFEDCRSNKNKHNLYDFDDSFGFCLLTKMLCFMKMRDSSLYSPLFLVDDGRKPKARIAEIVKF